jgi:hypothetical protein
VESVNVKVDEGGHHNLKSHVQIEDPKKNKKKNEKNKMKNKDQDVKTQRHHLYFFERIAQKI